MHIAQVTSWAEGPKYVNVPDLPAPSADQIKLKVLAAGLHQVVRSRASGTHYSAKQLPHIPGVDCVAVDEKTGKQYYIMAVEDGFGTFSEYINVDKRTIIPVPDHVDSGSLAASVNPAMSSWMAITSRTSDLPENFTVLIIGATSASGRLAVNVSRALGAGKVIGAGRNAASLAEVAGLDDTIVFGSTVSETDWSKTAGVDVVLDYVWGDVTQSFIGAVKSKKPVQLVQIGALGGKPTIDLMAPLLRSTDLTIRGAGPGSWRLSALAKQLPQLVTAMANWNLIKGQELPLKDIEKVWNDQAMLSQGRTVFVP